MKAFVKHAFRQLLVLLVSVSVAFAQTPPPASRKAAATQPELDQMLAPIALYPDSLLSQIFMASTYPLEVVEAARWSRANPGLNGQAAVQAVEEKDWEASVKALAAFPQVLAMMDQQIEWTARLGDVFIAQEPQVMETVQNLRQKAYAAGNLKSTQQAYVSQQGEALAIEPVSPQVVYVPYYDSRVMYGSWWWPAYPPVYWAPWPGYYAYPGYPVGFFWGPGIIVGAGFFYSSCDWHRRRITVVHVNRVVVNRPGVVNRPHAGTTPVAWRHDPAHRRGVPYRIASVQKQYGRSTAAGERRDFRWQGPIAPATRNSALNRPEAHGAPGRSGVSPKTAARSGEARPEAHGPVSRPHAAPAPAAPKVQAGPGNVPQGQGQAPQPGAGRGQAGKHAAPSAGKAHGEGRGR